MELVENIKIEMPENIIMNIDGENGGHGSFDYKVCRNLIKIYTN